MDLFLWHSNLCRPSGQDVEEAWSRALSYCYLLLENPTLCVDSGEVFRVGLVETVFCNFLCFIVKSGMFLPFYFIIYDFLLKGFFCEVPVASCIIERVFRDVLLYVTYRFIAVLFDNLWLFLIFVIIVEVIIASEVRLLIIPSYS